MSGCRSSLLFLAAALTLAPKALAQQGSVPSGIAVTTEVVRLRATSSPSARVVSSVPAGYPVYLGSCERAWCEVTYMGVRGYARETSLTTPVSPERPVPAEAEGSPAEADGVRVRPLEEVAEVPPEERQREPSPEREEPDEASQAGDLPATCRGFGSHAEAQEHFEQRREEVLHLDGDGDGTACEELLAAADSPPLASPPFSFRSVKEREKARRLLVASYQRQQQRRALAPGAPEKSVSKWYAVVAGLSALSSLVALLLTDTSP